MKARVPADRRQAADVLGWVAKIPSGRVVSYDTLAALIGQLPSVVSTHIQNFTADERDTAPWHRVVAKGGAIGRGPHRDAQFARLVREGIAVSPAGIVQDMARVAVTKLEAVEPSTGQGHRDLDRSSALPAQPLSRSRGMKDRPA